MITSNKTFISFILSLAFCMSFFLTGCGSSPPSTLEEYVSTNETVAQEIESYISEGMSIDVNDNTLIYCYTYPNSIDKATAKIMSEQLDKAYEPMTDTFDTLKSNLIKTSRIEQVTIKVMYIDADDDVIFEIVF